jgi:hypothetical protein
MQFDDPHNYRFDFDRMESFEIGAWLLAILAFAASDEMEKRREAAEAWISCAIRTADPGVIEQWHETFPFSAVMDIKEERRRLRTVPRRLRDRMLAARMSFGFLAEHMTDQKEALPESMQRLSLNELSKLVQDQSRESEPENIEHRVWRKSRPVIHLASAMQFGMRAVAGDRALDSVKYDLTNAALHRAAIDLANIYEEIVLSDSRMGVTEDMLIRIRYR